MNGVRYIKDDLVIIDFRENITISSDGVGKLARLIEDISCRGVENIILNLQDVRLIDSRGIGLLVKSLSVFKKAYFKLLKPNRIIMTILRVSKLVDDFEIFQDEAEAVNSFEKPA